MGQEHVFLDYKVGKFKYQKQLLFEHPILVPNKWKTI